MKKFEFRLAVVKKLKERKVDDQKEFLAQSQKTFEQEQESLRVLHAEKKSVREYIAKFKSELDFHRAEHAKAYEDGVDYKIVSQELKLQDAYGAVKYAERLLADAVKDVKIYEKLEEKALNEYRKERLKFEQDQIDDVSLILRTKRGR